MKVRVTGAGGFVGRSLVRELAAAGHEVVPAIPGAQAVVHLAAIAHRRAGADELEAVNVQLAERTAREAAAAGAHFVFLSSVKVHGESAQAPLDERSPFAPADAYAASKARAEETLRAIAGLKLTVLRPPLVYGPGVKANFLALMRAVARGLPLPLASVSNRRSFLYVGNLADAIVACLASRSGGTFLLSDGAALATPDLCRRLGEALARPAWLVPFPQALLPRKLAASLEINDTAIRGALGWRPRFPLEAGLRSTASWYLGR